MHGQTTSDARRLFIRAPGRLEEGRRHFGGPEDGCEPLAEARLGLAQRAAWRRGALRLAQPHSGDRLEDLRQPYCSPHPPMFQHGLPHMDLIGRESAARGGGGYSIKLPGLAFSLRAPKEGLGRPRIPRTRPAPALPAQPARPANGPRGASAAVAHRVGGVLIRKRRRAG
ncbi:hypothetical protein CALCODRAFT_181341 [Calocera cornea HHB12733]|uniref:Uncharacterized protein n=1 Tax=Calocera cornea HHB12733 TaxID=1353952 RepID=A0A165HRG7_9BASI|nr:hypothetical protein CALCODRAFT_181341 [Calocera cornea HHB12733]